MAGKIFACSACQSEQQDLGHVGTEECSTRAVQRAGLNEESQRKKCRPEEVKKCYSCRLVECAPVSGLNEKSAHQLSEAIKKEGAVGS
jgi:hypothetical protein